VSTTLTAGCTASTLFDCSGIIFGVIGNPEISLRCDREATEVCGESEEDRRLRNISASLIRDTPSAVFKDAPLTMWIRYRTCCERVSRERR